MRTLLNLSATLGIILSLSACATKTVVLDRQSDVVRLGPNVRGKVYVWKKETGWTLSGKVTLPEGWYAGPPPK